MRKYKFHFSIKLRKNRNNFDIKMERKCITHNLLMITFKVILQGDTNSFTARLLHNCSESTFNSGEAAFILNTCIVSVQLPKNVSISIRVYQQITTR